MFDQQNKTEIYRSIYLNSIYKIRDIVDLWQKSASFDKRCWDNRTEGNQIPTSHHTQKSITDVFKRENVKQKVLNF